MLLVLAASGLARAAPAQDPELPPARQRAADFDALWRALDQGYAYFGADRGAWRAARDPWRARALNARTRPEYLRALVGATARLRDDHVTLSEAAEGAARRVPAETDIWGYWRDDVAIVEAVRTYGDADVAGLRPGHVIRSINGLPVARAVSDFIGRPGAGSAAARDWGLRHVLAGPRAGALRIEMAEARGSRTYEVTRGTHAAAPGPPLIARRVGEGRDLGYIRIKAALSDATLAGQFDSALDYLKDSRGLILDLREVTGPFAGAAKARATTLAILGRFTARAAPWQVRESRAGERTTDWVAARAPAYPGTLVVLVDRWTAGEGEALAAGLQAAGRARLIGTRMAGLRGELAEARLPHSGISLRYPGEKTFHVDGTPRESLRPDIFVDLAAPQGGPGDPILYQGLKALEK